MELKFITFFLLLQTLEQPHEQHFSFDAQFSSLWHLTIHGVMRPSRGFGHTPSLTVRHNALLVCGSNLHSVFMGHVVAYIKKQNFNFLKNNFWILETNFIRTAQGLYGLHEHFWQPFSIEKFVP